MKKQFHYYAIRYLTSAMGFPDDVSQLIASVSQFIDDCTQEDLNHKYEKSDIPTEIIKRKLYKEAENKLIIPVPKTAVIRGTDDVINNDLLNKDSQIKAFVPFHYYPPERVSEKRDYYVEPITDFNNTPLKEIVKNSISKYISASQQSSTMTDNLASSAINIGVIVHVIADTYAHRFFNGFQSDVNDTKVLKIQENETMKVIEKEYPSADVLLMNPNVGCARVGTTVDDLNLVLSFEQKTDDDPPGFRSGGHIVFTNKAFINAAYMMYKYFLMVLGQTDPNDIHWKGMYLKVITGMAKLRGFPDADFENLLKISLAKNIDLSYDAVNILYKLTNKASWIGAFAIAVDDIRKSI